MNTTLPLDDSELFSLSGELLSRKQASADTEPAGDFAGSLLTRSTDSFGTMTLDIRRLAAANADTNETATAVYTFGRLSGCRDGACDDMPPMDVGTILDTGRRLEGHFNKPLRLEWTWKDEQFHLLDVKDTEQPATQPTDDRALQERERARVLAELQGRRRQSLRRIHNGIDNPLLVQTRLSQQLPRPTPLSADLMHRLLDADGATDIACREFGVPYLVHPRSVPMFTTLFGWTYTNVEEELRRKGSRVCSLATFRLLRDAESITGHYLENYLPRRLQEMVARDNLVLDILDLSELTALFEVWIDEFITQSSVQAERIRILAECVQAAACKQLRAEKLEPVDILTLEQDSIAAHAWALVSGTPAAPEVMDQFLMLFGQRAPNDYELAQPRFAEDPRSAGRHLDDTLGLQGLPREPAGKTRVLTHNNALSEAVDKARHYASLCEDARHYSLIELAQIRRLLLRIDEAAGLDGLVFYLEIDEVPGLCHRKSRAQLVERATQRREDARAWANYRAPATLSLNDLERVDLLNECESGWLEHSRESRFLARDRRTMKAMGSDRRRKIRMGDDGKPDFGRRAADRARNLSVYRDVA